MLTITLPVIDRPEPKPKAIVSDRRLYLARDERTVIEVGDDRAAFLLVSAGGSIAGADVERLSLSLVDGRVVQQLDSPTPSEEKQVVPEADKQDAPQADAASQPEDDKQSAPQGDKADKSKRERK